MKKSFMLLMVSSLLVSAQIFADDVDVVQEDYVAIARQDEQGVQQYNEQADQQILIENAVPQNLQIQEPLWYSENLDACNNLTKAERLQIVNAVFTMFWVSCVKLDDDHSYYQGLQKDDISEQHNSYLYLRRLEKDLSHLTQLQVNYLFSRVINDLYIYFIVKDIQLPYEQKIEGQPDAMSQAERTRVLQMVKIMFTKLYPPVFGNEHVSFVQKVDDVLQSLSRKATANSLASFMCWSFDFYCKELGIDMMRPLEV